MPRHAAKQSQNSPTENISFHLAPYEHTNPWIICTHSFHSNTLLHIQTPRPTPLLPCDRHRIKKATDRPRSTHLLTVEFPCDSSDSTSSCGNTDGRFMTSDTSPLRCLKVSTLSLCRQGGPSITGTS